MFLWVRQTLAISFAYFTLNVVHHRRLVSSFAVSLRNLHFPEFDRTPRSAYNQPAKSQTACSISIVLTYPRIFVSETVQLPSIFLQIILTTKCKVDRNPNLVFFSFVSSENLSKFTVWTSTKRVFQKFLPLFHSRFQWLYCFKCFKSTLNSTDDHWKSNYPTHLPIFCGNTLKHQLREIPQNV